MGELKGEIPSYFDKFKNYMSNDTKGVEVHFISYLFLLQL